MSVVVVTDTAASFTLGGPWRIWLVRLTVTVAGKSYSEGEIDLSSIAHATVTSAGPPPSTFLAVLQDAADGAVVVTVAGSLSSTHAAA